MHSLKHIIFLLIMVQYLFSGQVLAQGDYWHNKERELRYTPEGNDFVIINGDKKFTRALYGTNTAFRIETSDVPEFGFFMPNMGGNLQLGITKGKHSIWLNNAKYIKATYRAGARIYEIKDPLLGKGKLHITVLAMENAEGMVMQVVGYDIPSGIEFTCMFGGATNKRFYRNGDLGVDAPDCFDLKPEACINNVYSINKNEFSLEYGKGSRSIRHSIGIFPLDSKLKTGSPYSIEFPNNVWSSIVREDKPVLLAKFPIKSTSNYYVSIRNTDTLNLSYAGLPQAFEQAENQRRKIAGSIKIETPDNFINPIGGALSIAADGIWDNNCWLHGAIGWRMPLNGWRAAYTGDCLGWHERSRTHFNNYAASQIKNMEPSIDHPAQDTSRNFARAAKIWATPMYSKGYICRSPNDTSKMHHYDMNLCYIDELLWHFNWTGDLDYAKQMWPVLQRHLDWEKRNFDPDNDGLYDAYASIWASDALYYNSGAVTHSSAYNYRANKMAAEIAEKIGENAEPYEKEAEKIIKAINNTLWMQDKGVWAEFKDFMGNQRLHTTPAIWTIYHAIDSDISTPFQSYQATRYVDTQIPQIPVLAKGLKDEGYYTISTSSWKPYSWSINNVAIAEVGHMCLAYWQSGQSDKAFKLFKSIILDGMYLGSSPGNIGQISFYDAARGECYRDFGDPVGVLSRGVTQGLFGITPHLLDNKVVIRPGFPSNWNEASMATSDIEYQFKRVGLTDNYTIKSHFNKAVTIELLVKAQKDQIESVSINGKKQFWTLVENVGYPLIKITSPIKEKLNISIKWNGNSLDTPDYPSTGVKGKAWQLSSANEILAVKDPQGIVGDAKIENNKVQALLQGKVGQKTIFVQLRQGDMTWWQPIDLEMKEPVSVKCDPSLESLQVVVHNNQTEQLKGEITVNIGENSFEQKIEITPNASSAPIKVPSEISVLGTNKISIEAGGRTIFESNITNWNIPNNGKTYEAIDITKHLNASVSDIFKQQYLSPRSPYTTLQIPTQGIGEWCHPTHTASISDTGFRQSIKNGVLNTPMGIPFKSVSELGRNNIAFTSLWDNYPDSIKITLTGKASHAYLLMAGSTNHMQYSLVNGTIAVQYKDGSADTLNLVTPDNWLPIEQDLYIDGFAFKNKQPRPYRIAFKNGTVSQNLQKEMGINENEVYGRTIDGGAGTILDLPLQPDKELESITIKTIANEVIIGLMSLTLMK